MSLGDAAQYDKSREGEGKVYNGIAGVSRRGVGYGADVVASLSGSC